MTLQGRTGRRQFAIAIVLTAGADAALFPIWAQTDREGPILWLGFALLVAIAAVGFAAVVRRLHDVDLSARGLYLFALGVGASGALMRSQSQEVRDDLMLIGLAIGLTGLAIAPGTAGENRFGPPPQTTARTS